MSWDVACASRVAVHKPGSSDILQGLVSRATLARQHMEIRLGPLESTAVLAKSVLGLHVGLGGHKKH